MPGEEVSDGWVWRAVAVGAAAYAVGVFITLIGAGVIGERTGAGIGVLLYAVLHGFPLFSGDGTFILLTGLPVGILLVMGYLTATRVTGPEQSSIKRNAAVAAGYTLVSGLSMLVLAPREGLLAVSAGLFALTTVAALTYALVFITLGAAVVNSRDDNSGYV
ncbi:MAG: hypothetical protein ACI9HI_002062 [Salinirussus sp.]|jgi:hypothetical protein